MTVQAFRDGDLKPSRVSGRTVKRTWLQCPTCGYEWRESLRGARKESRKCPSCHGEGCIISPRAATTSDRRDRTSPGSSTPI
ncbi:zinc-ribbon domain-containing protein [Senegalimassilia anaerobia]